MSLPLLSPSDDHMVDDPIDVVMVDDDRNDHLLLQMAADEAGLNADFTFLDDGSELLFRLADVEQVDELPDLVVLDLQMSSIGGHKVLDELQAHPIFWQIPVVVFSSSTRRTDEVGSYQRGARWFETKPSRFPELVHFASSLGDRSVHTPYDASELCDLSADTEAPTGDELGAARRMHLLASDLTAEVEDMLIKPPSDARTLGVIDDIE